MPHSTQSMFCNFRNENRDVYDGNTECSLVTRHTIHFVAFLVLTLIVATDALAEPLWERIEGGPDTTCALGACRT